MGVALRVYLDTSDGVFPYAANLPVRNAKGSAYWFDALGSTMPNTKWGEGVLRCPAYQGFVYEGGSDRDNVGSLKAQYAPCGSFVYNVSGRRAPGGGQTDLVRSGLGFLILDGQPLDKPVRESEVRAPAEMYGFGDAPITTGPWGRTSEMSRGGAADYNSLMADNTAIESAQHGVGFNMLLADAHVEIVKTNALLGRSAIHRSRWNRDHLP